MVYRLWQWASTPSPLPIPLSPAPRTRAGVVWRLLLETLLFRALARGDKVTWGLSLLFHYGLLLVVLMHLRFLLPLLPAFIIPLLFVSGWAALASSIGLAGLLLRRFANDRLRYISAPSDYLHLVLLLLIVGSGVLLKRVWPVDLFAVGQFLRGTLSLDWQPLPAALGVYLHVSLVLLLIIIFPISKLVHGPGIVFSPTLHQRDPHGGHQAGKRSDRADDYHGGSEGVDQGGQLGEYQGERPGKHQGESPGNHQGEHQGRGK